MSDEHSSSSSAAVSPDGADQPRPAGAPLPFAIVAHAPDAADAIWNVMDGGLPQKWQLSIQRRARAQAGAIVYLPTPEDFADEGPAHAFADEIARDTAPLKFLLEPGQVDDAARERMTSLLARVDGPPVGWIHLKAPGKDDPGEHDAARLAHRQARVICKAVAAAISPPENFLAADDDGAGAHLRDKTARREALVAKKAARQAELQKMKDDPVRLAARAAKKAERQAQNDKAARLAAKASRQAAIQEAKSDPVRLAAQATRKAERQKAKDESARAKAAAADTMPLAAKAAQKRPPRPPEEAPEKKAVKPRRADQARPSDETGQVAEGGEAGSGPAAPKGPRPLTIAIVGMDKESGAALHAAIEGEFRGAGAGIVAAPSPERAHIVVHAFDEAPPETENLHLHAGAIAKGKALARIFLERIAPRTVEEPHALAVENRAIARIAHLCGGSLPDLVAKFRRHGGEHLEADGRPSAAGHGLIAQSVLGMTASGKLRKFLLIRKPVAMPPDLAEAYLLAEAPSALLAQLTWGGSSPPKLLRAVLSQAGVEAFADSKLVLDANEARDFGLPIDWAMPLSGRRARISLFGLEFLLAPLTYWYCKANGREAELVATIDAHLKQRGVTASELLARAGEIIVDFAAKNSREANPAAWDAETLPRRARVLTLYVLCCKAAVKRRIKFDEALCGAVFRNLLDLIEALRGDEFYEPGSVDGARQDCLLVGVALSLQKTAYADHLLRDALDRLRRFQLDLGLSAEGVWRTGSFADHCSLLGSMAMLLGELGASNADAVEPFAEATRKMTVFADAMLKSDGRPLPVDETRAKSYAETLSGARRVLAQAGQGAKKKPPTRGMAQARITDTYIFRDAQYFVSHSTQKVTAESSQFVLHALPASIVSGDPGGIVLAFAHGPADLIVRAAPVKPQPGADKAPRFDAALRNGYHVNGESSAPAKDFGPGIARIVKSWRGAGWAAAKCVDDTYGDATVTRTAIHLKAHHALIVIDELASRSGAEALFEQFWNVAPEFGAAATEASPIVFASPAGGHLAAAFDGQCAATAAVEDGASGPRLRRSARLARGIMASLFQWTTEPRPAAISVLRHEGDDWAIAVSGLGFDGQFALAANELRYQDAHSV